MIQTIQDLELEDKITLVRADFNVPTENGLITDSTRVKASLPTIKMLIAAKSKIIIFSHFGRVKTRDDLKTKTLAPVAALLSKLLNDYPVKFINDIEGKVLEEAVSKIQPGQIILVENTRFADVMESNGQFNVKANRESGNSPELGKYWASLGEIFINDAFGTAHRSHASNVGIASNIKKSAIGLLVEKELKNLDKIINEPKRPLVSIIGGAKVSSKIDVMGNLLKISDYVIIGGGMAYTFKAAQGKVIGTSLFEADKVEVATKFLNEYPNKILLPVDFTESLKFENSEPKYTKDDNIDPNYMGMDIGPRSIEGFTTVLQHAKTIFWNGPLGVFEMSNYAVGTSKICEVMANLKNCFRVIGGGDSAAAATTLGFNKAFDHISTGGGASLEYIAGKTLPGIESIQQK